MIPPTAPRPRTADTCRYRSEVRPDGAGAGAGESAACGLLTALTGRDGREPCRVGRDACEACCRVFPPTPAAINPVIASLLFGLASREGPAGCEAGTADALRRRAVGALAEVPGRGASSGPTPLLRTSIPGPGRGGPRVTSWAVGVTTAPRRRPTLDRCLASLERAGWPRPHLFVDSPVELPRRASTLPRTYRDVRLGAWPSYRLALEELLMRDPRADAFLLAQDDALFHDREPIRDYLESEVLWPAGGPAVLSLYCPAPYTRPDAGWHALREPWGWGALAFVYPNELARAFVLDRAVFDHRWNGRSQGLAHIDVVVGRWAGRNGVAVWHPSPSLVQHVGETSSLWANSRAAGDRRASWFAGDPVRGS